MLKTKGIYAITDCINTSEEELLIKTEDILNTGIALLQYRNKEVNYTQKKEIAIKLQRLCKKYNTPFIINDDISLAEEISADGIHLGKDDLDLISARKRLPNKIIGISCYASIEKALIAEKETANYIAFGAFFPSITKPDAVKAEIELIKIAKTKLSVPIVAIGGITPENGKQLINAGVDYLAVISGLYSVSDTIAATESYNNLFN